MCALYVDILQAGTNSHGATVDDFNALATDFLTDGVVGVITNTAGVAPTTGAFAVNAQGTPDMTVAVTAGKAYVTGTPTSGVSQRLRVNLDANQNVTIASNATGGTRYDWLYIKLDAAKMKDPAVDASDVATLVTSRSTSASTDNGTPPTYGYCIAVITVANGAATIANASIADKRISLDLATKAAFAKGDVNNVLVQSGWGFTTTAGGDGLDEKAITFTVPYDASTYPNITITYCGTKATAGEPANPAAGTTAYAACVPRVKLGTISNTGFTAEVTLTTGTFTNGYYNIFTWVAVGTKAR